MILSLDNNQVENIRNNFHSFVELKQVISRLVYNNDFDDFKKFMCKKLNIVDAFNFYFLYNTEIQLAYNLVNYLYSNNIIDYNAYCFIYEATKTKFSTDEEIISKIEYIDSWTSNTYLLVEQGTLICNIANNLGFEAEYATASGVPLEHDFFYTYEYYNKDIFNVFKESIDNSLIEDLRNLFEQLYEEYAEDVLYEYLCKFSMDEEDFLLIKIKNCIPDTKDIQMLKNSIDFYETKFSILSKPINTITIGRDLYLTMLDSELIDLDEILSIARILLKQSTKNSLNI